MQRLDVVGWLFPLISSGEKTSTIRWQEPRIKPGYMLYVNEDNPEQTIVVWVTQCTDMPLSNVSAYLDKEEERPDPVMLKGMKEHCPDIKLISIVQLIEHLTPSQSQDK